jgi:hypothetical protein
MRTSLEGPPIMADLSALKATPEGPPILTDLCALKATSLEGPPILTDLCALKATSLEGPPILTYLCAPRANISCLELNVNLVHVSLYSAWSTEAFVKVVTFSILCNEK